jgi:hypothetical protein
MAPKLASNAASAVRQSPRWAASGSKAASTPSSSKAALTGVSKDAKTIASKRVTAAGAVSQAGGGVAQPGSKANKVDAQGSKANKASAVSRTNIVPRNLAAALDVSAGVSANSQPEDDSSLLSMSDRQFFRFIVSKVPSIERFEQLWLDVGGLDPLTIVGAYRPDTFQEDIRADIPALTRPILHNLDIFVSDAFARCPGIGWSSLDSL